MEPTAAAASASIQVVLLPKYVAAEKQIRVGKAADATHGIQVLMGLTDQAMSQFYANPIGAIWAGAMMLNHLGHSGACASIMSAIEHVLAEAAELTPDMGGRSNTQSLGRAIAAAV